MCRLYFLLYTDFVLQYYPGNIKFISMNGNDLLRIYNHICLYFSMNSESIFQLPLKINNLFCFIKHTMDNFSIAKTDPWSRFVIRRPLNNNRSIVPITIFVKFFISDQALKSLVSCTVSKFSYHTSCLSFRSTKRFLSFLATLSPISEVSFSSDSC